MNHRPCATLCPPGHLKRPPLPAVLALFALAALFCPAAPALAEPPSAQAAAGDEPDRGLGSAPVRHVLVKAVGQGVTVAEAEQNALRAARLMAAKHYASLGGAAALDTSPRGMRTVATHNTPPMGLASVRAVVLLELRLKALPEPPPAALALPVLNLSVDASGLQVEANRPCEVLTVLVPASGDGEPLLLPGGGGAAYRLAPGKPMRQALPPMTSPTSVRVLACTGGINAPAAAPTLEESLAKARAGKPRPAIMQGVVSECVLVQTPPPALPAAGKRSMRQKGSEAPVDMTGVAGREGGLPVPKGAP